MIALTDEQHRAIEDAGGSPVRVEDPSTKTMYVLLNAELYERIRALVEADDPSPEEFAPMIWDAMKGDWDDPAMDAYDRYPGGSWNEAKSSSCESHSWMEGASDGRP